MTDHTLLPFFKYNLLLESLLAEATEREGQLRRQLRRRMTGNLRGNWKKSSWKTSWMS